MSGWRRSRKGNLWKQHNDRRAVVRWCERRSGFYWAVFSDDDDDGPRYSAGVFDDEDDCCLNADDYLDAIDNEF